MSSDHDNRNAPRPGAGDPPDSGAEFSRAKVFWYSPALNAFFDLNSADYKLLLLFLGIYGTEDPAKAAATVERALRDPPAGGDRPALPRPCLPGQAAADPAHL